MPRNHVLLPNEISGYAFDPGPSWWSTIVPEESTNLLINPSFEVDTTDQYTTSGTWGAGSERVEHPTVQAAFGRACFKLVTDSADAWLANDMGATVTAGNYTFSVYAYVPLVGYSVFLEVRDGSNNLIARRVHRVTRVAWQRYDLTYQEASSGARKLRFGISGTYPTGTILYTDAWQFERKAYPTTYLDGDMIGLSDARPNQSYYWTGTPHYSQSVRRVDASNGGVLTPWSAVTRFKTTSIVGLNMAPIDIREATLASGATVHRGAVGTSRPFTISGRIFGCDYDELVERFDTLIALLRPNNTANGDQMILQYQYVDERGGNDGEPLDIACIFNSGLEGNITNYYQQAVALQFRAAQPYLARPLESSAALSLYKELVTNNVIFKDETGDYINLGTGASDASPTHVGFLRDGSPVAFGPFSSLAGDAVDDSAYWDGANWQQLGNLAGASAADVIDGYTSGYPLTIATTVGDVYEYDDDTDAWVQVGGSGFVGGINAIARDPAGNIWVAGEFDTDDALDTYNNVAMWNILTEAWEPLGAGLTDPGATNPTLAVYTVLADGDGYVYFGGWFEQGDSGATTTFANGAIRWNPQTAEWDAMGLGFDAAPNQFVRGQDGYIYAVGEFAQDGTDTYDLRGFARWNGYQWEEVFPLVRQDGTYGADGVAVDENGIFWFFAYVTDTDTDLFVVPTLGEVGTFGWKDGVFYPSIGSVSITHMAIGPGNRTIYAVRAIDAGDSYVVPALNEITYEGSADTFVSLHVEGKCTPIQCVNLDTHGGIYFRADLVVAEHEELVVRNDTQQSLVYSSFRPNLKRFISAGATSFKSLRLMPGVNRISVFAQNIVSADASAWLTWKDKFWGLQ